MAAAVFGAGSLRAPDGLARQRHALRHQGPRPVRRALGKRRPPTVAAAEQARNARGYFRPHAARRRYPAFRARHFPIGSAAIERTAKNLIQQRQTQAGMRGRPTGAQAVASLRALHRSGRWTAFWQRQPQARRRLRAGGRASVPTAPTTAEADRPLAPGALPADPNAPPPATATPLPAPAVSLPSTQRSQTAGKPWCQHRAWRDRPLYHRRSA